MSAYKITGRPVDVCAFCDRPIDMADGARGWWSLHVYVGPGLCHGGARENIGVHVGCLTFAEPRLFEKHGGPLSDPGYDVDDTWPIRAAWAAMSGASA